MAFAEKQADIISEGGKITRSCGNIIRKVVPGKMFMSSLFRTWIIRAVH